MMVRTRKRSKPSSDSGEKIEKNHVSKRTKKEEVPKQRFSDIPMEDIRLILDKFAADRDWAQYHTPRNLVLAMMGEVGEVAELFQWRHDSGARTGLSTWTEQEILHLGEELSDVFLYLIRLADITNIDLPARVLDKLEKNAVKYPKHKVYGSSKKYTEYE